MEADNSSRLTDRLGFQGKTLWDYVQLLIVPVILSGAAIWFQFESSNAARESEERRAKAEQEIQVARDREAALQGYLDRMTELLLSEDAKSEVFPEKMRSVARALLALTGCVAGLELAQQVCSSLLSCWCCSGASC